MGQPEDARELFEDSPKYEEELQLLSQWRDNILYILRTLGAMPDEVLEEIGVLINAELESQEKKRATNNH